MKFIDADTAGYLEGAAQDQRTAQLLAISARGDYPADERQNFARMAKIFGRWCESRLWHIHELETGREKNEPSNNRHRNTVWDFESGRVCQRLRGKTLG
jgi:hypothetical protein